MLSSVELGAYERCNVVAHKLLVQLNLVLSSLGAQFWLRPYVNAPLCCLTFHTDLKYLMEAFKREKVKLVPAYSQNNPTHLCGVIRHVIKFKFCVCCYMRVWTTMHTHCVCPGVVELPTQERGCLLNHLYLPATYYTRRYKTTSTLNSGQDQRRLGMVR